MILGFRIDLFVYFWGLGMFVCGVGLGCWCVADLWEVVCCWFMFVCCCGVILP